MRRLRLLQLLRQPLVRRRLLRLPLDVDGAEMRGQTKCANETGPTTNAVTQSDGKATEGRRRRSGRENAASRGGSQHRATKRPSRITELGTWNASTLRTAALCMSR
jgi:hypothetical protein